MVALGIIRDGPVDQVQIDIIQPEILQALIQRLLDLCVVRVPELAGDEDVLALADARGEGLCEAGADFGFVAVAVRAVDVAVAGLEGGFDGGFGDAGGGLPGSW